MARMRTWGIAAAWTLIAAAQACALDAATKAKAKELLEKYKEAVVTLKVVVTERYVVQGREDNKQEQKMEITGTVIAPSGLTVTSNYSLDPSSAWGDFSWDDGGEKTEFKRVSEIAEIKIVLADGTEVPAELVLKDKDLDLAFVKPKEKPENPYPFLAFAKPSADPEVLDEVIGIGRLGRVVKRVNSLRVGEVTAVVKTPRTLYVCAGEMGCPVFNAKGETLGLSAMRLQKESGGHGGGAMMQPVVIPSEDLLDAAKQAAAKAEEKKDEKKDEAKEEKKP